MRMARAVPLDGRRYEVSDSHDAGAEQAACHDSRNTSNGASDLLALAAAPTFACMAVLTGLPGGDPMGMLCSAQGGWSWSGMALMYGLMSVFHARPWLGWIAARRRRARARFQTAE